MPHKVLFVCLGNICRSPLAEGIFRALVEERGLDKDFVIDSAGTGAWHIGSPPDPRSVETAARYGIDISAQRARQVAPGDFPEFHTIVAMDRSNLTTLKSRATAPHQTKIRLLLTGPDTEVPDPYYGGPDGFENVYRLLRGGSGKLLDDLVSAKR